MNYKRTAIGIVTGLLAFGVLAITTDQIFQNVYDAVNLALRVNVVAGSTAGGGSAGGGGGGSAPPGTVGTALTSGCGVAWSGSGYVYNVQACSYSINGASYNSPQTTLTLVAPDATLDRIDSIVVNTSSVATTIQGTLSSTPSQPAIDPTTQLNIVFILVTHNTSNPVSASNETIYDENVEWTGTAGTGWVLNDTSNPHTGTINIKATNLIANNFTKWIRSSSIGPGGYQQLNLWISPIAWPTNRALSLQFRLSGVTKGNAVTIQNGSFGFSRTALFYQLVVIPLNLFALPAGNVDELRINPTGGGGAASLSFYMDSIVLQTTTNSQPAQGISVAQADARYMQQAAPNYFGPLTLPKPIPMSGNLTADTSSTNGTGVPDRWVDCTSGSSTFTYTLPACVVPATSSVTGTRIIDLTKVDTGAGSCVAQAAGSDKINNAATTRTLATTMGKHDTLSCHSTGQWFASGDGT